MLKHMTKRLRKKHVIIVISIAAGLSLICFIGVAIAHMSVFARAEYSEYASDRYLLYEDLDAARYPREYFHIQSGENQLAAYLYGANSNKGLIVISPGHRDANDIKLYEITYFVDAGWMVLCYDYTGCYNSEGGSMVGYTQSAHDLDAVLRFAETDDRLSAFPVMLFGHSLGGYASAAVLAHGHDVKAAIIASAFDTPKEQWTYSIERFTGVFHIPLLPFTSLFTAVTYGDDAGLSAIDGINATDTPVLVISGTEDEYYGGESPVYKKRDLVSNPNCEFRLMEIQGHRGHYDYFLMDAAVRYQELVEREDFSGQIDKSLYMEHDKGFMDSLNNFFLDALES